MQRRFSTCLNLEAKAFNFSLSGLVLGALGLVFGMCFVGLLTALASGVVGFIIGKIFGSKWHSGEFQRNCYSKLPLTRLLVCDKIPNYHIRNYH